MHAARLGAGIGGAGPGARARGGLRLGAAGGGAIARGIQGPVTQLQPAPFCAPCPADRTCCPLRRYWQKRPVTITNFTSRWPAGSSWAKQPFLARCGSRSPPPHRQPLHDSEGSPVSRPAERLRRDGPGTAVATQRSTKRAATWPPGPRRSGPRLDGSQPLWPNTPGGSSVSRRPSAPGGKITLAPAPAVVARRAGTATGCWLSWRPTAPTQTLSGSRSSRCDPPPNWSPRPRTSPGHGFMSHLRSCRVLCHSEAGKPALLARSRDYYLFGGRCL